MRRGTFVTSIRVHIKFYGLGVSRTVSSPLSDMHVFSLLLSLFPSRDTLYKI